jgi:hypothetical protein
MKVLQLAWHYYPRVGGIETLLKNLNDRINREQYDVEVLVSGEKEENLTIGGVQVHYTPLLRLFENAFTQEELKKGLKAIFAKINPGLIH